MHEPMTDPLQELAFLFAQGYLRLCAQRSEGQESISGAAKDALMFLANEAFMALRLTPPEMRTIRLRTRKEPPNDHRRST